jgi:hypothetical protein
VVDEFVKQVEPERESGGFAVDAGGRTDAFGQRRVSRVGQNAHQTLVAGLDIGERLVRR